MTMRSIRTGSNLPRASRPKSHELLRSGAGDIAGTRRRCASATAVKVWRWAGAARSTQPSHQYHGLRRGAAARPWRRAFTADRREPGCGTRPSVASELGCPDRGLCADMAERAGVPTDKCPWLEVMPSLRWLVAVALRTEHDLRQLGFWPASCRWWHVRRWRHSCLRKQRPADHFRRKRSKGVLQPDRTLNRSFLVQSSRF